MMINVFGNRIQRTPVGAVGAVQVHAFAVTPQLLDFGSGLVDRLGAGFPSFESSGILIGVARLRRHW